MTAAPGRPRAGLGPADWRNLDSAAVRGIVSAAGYIPFRRLARADIRATFGAGGGAGTRSVASYDQDTTTLGVEAARLVRRGGSDGGGVPAVDALWFATANPAYLDKTNAAAIHAALRLDTATPAFDFGGALRSGIGALRAALDGRGATLVVSSDMRTGLPTSPDESAGGDGAAAILVGDDSDGPLLAEYLGAASATEEFIDRWRTPGALRSKAWEERFGETKYGPLGERAWREALAAAGIEAGDVESVVATGLHARATRALARMLGVDATRVVDDLATTVGNTGTAHAGLLLASALELATPGQVIALVGLADGVDVLIFRATDAVVRRVPARSVQSQIDEGAPVAYGTFLSWRQMVELEPPRRPEPARVSAAAAGRSEDWKFGFVGSLDEHGTPQLPPVPGARRVPMADAPATIVTFTVDRLAYSPSPPIVFAVVDFDGGGRFPVELTDVDAEKVAIGDRVEMTFRRLSTADGIHNYFWKARPIPGASEGE